MKRFIISLLFMLLTINIYSSNNYTIAIVPLIKGYTTANKIAQDNIASITNSISDKTISTINSKACDEILNLFNKYLINSLSLNYEQKLSYLKNKYRSEISEDKKKLSSYYVEIANNNYSTFDRASIDTKILELKVQIDKKNEQLSTLNSNKVINDSEEVDYPNNVKTSTKSKNIIEVKIFKNYIDSFLLSNYGNFYTSMFQKENSVNEIIFVEVDRINNFNNLKIYSKNINDDEKVLIFDKIIENDSIPSLSPYILESLINFYFKDLTIVKNNIDKSNIVIKEIKKESILKELRSQEEFNNTLNQSDIIIDFDMTRIKSKDCVDLSDTSNYLILNSGIHYLFISGNNIYDYILKVISGRNIISSITKIGKEISRPPLTLYSEVGRVNWVVDGKDFGVNNSLVLNKPLVPSIILIKKDNFSNQLYALNSDKEYKNFNLNPSWMDSANIFEKKQSDFYQGLLNYILGCATFISIKTLNNLYGSSAISPFINNVSDGLLILAQIDIVYELVSYIKLATK